MQRWYKSPNVKRWSTCIYTVFHSLHGYWPVLNNVFARSDKVTSQHYTDVHKTFGVRCFSANYEKFSKRQHGGYIYRKSKMRLVVHFVRPCDQDKLFYSKKLILGKNIYFEVTVSKFNVNNSQGGDTKKCNVCFYDVAWYIYKGLLLQ